MMRSSNTEEKGSDVPKMPEDENPLLHGTADPKNSGKSSQPSKNFTEIFTQRKNETTTKSKESTTMWRAKMFNRIGLPWLFLLVTVGIYYGVIDALPQLYLGWAEWWITLVQCIFWFLILELMVNWYFLKTVTSNFSPAMCSADYMQRSCEESDSLAKEIFNPNNKAIPDHKAENLSERTVKYQDQRYVTLLIPDDNGKAKYMLYPYFTWRPCLACNMYRPPRAHHCPLCRTCVLKRDHHCFYSGSCVGVYNQRFFFVFTFWGMVLTVFAFLHLALYIVMVLWDDMSAWDLFFPTTILRFIFGYTNYLMVVYMFIFYSLLFMVPISFNYFTNQCELVALGLTSYEKDEDMKIIDTRSFEDKFRAILGKNWILTFLVPMHKVFPTQDDGIHWPTVKGTSC